jgi:hypothetical protein
MMRQWAAGLGLATGLWLTAAQAGELEWHPAGSATTPAAANIGVSLGRPVVLDDEPPPPPAAPPLIDPQVLRASFEADPPRPAVRAQSLDDAKRMPVGQPQVEPPLLDDPAPPAAKGKASEKPAAAEKPKGLFFNKWRPAGEVTSSTKPTPAAKPMPGAKGSKDLPAPKPVEVIPAPADAGPALVPEVVRPQPVHSTSDCGPDGLGGDGCCDPDCPCDDVCCPSTCFWVRAEYLLWGFKHGPVPPLVTSSPVESLGVIGMPGTMVISPSALDSTMHSGGRVTAGLWLDHCETWGIEASFFSLAENSANFQSGSMGMPLLARPFVNALTGLEDAELVANPAIPALPGLIPLSGMVHVSSSSQLWGAEINGICNITRWGCGRLDFLHGLRYIRLSEDLRVDENLMVPAGAVIPPDVPVLPGTLIGVQDRFNTRTQFYGDQIGLRTELNWRCWQLDILAKVAFGVSHQAVDISGSTQITPPGQPTSFFTGGLLAQPTNIGHYSRDKFAVVPEFGLNLGYHITDNWRVFVGYNFLYMSNVIRPGNTVDRTVNPSQIPPGTLTGPSRPQFTFKGTDFWAQGMNAGLEFKY